MSEQKNDREFTRVSINVRIELSCEGKTISSNNCQDVSMNGVYVISQDKFKENSSCDVTLLFNKDEKTCEEIKAQGHIERATENGMAIKFLGIEIESYDKLYELIVFNSASSEQMEKELQEHVVLKKTSYCLTSVSSFEYLKAHFSQHLP
jgi:hypothetical protein